MNHLWSPWRHEYIATAGSKVSHEQNCIFCLAQKSPADDAQNLVLHRGEHTFIILNRYPYISGHLMIAPNAHISEFDAAPKATTDEMTDLAKACQTVLREVYTPDGFNIGMNLGRAAGAGIAEHFHMHIMPRWAGDTNFMSTVGETRVLSEDLETTFRKLKPKF